MPYIIEHDCAGMHNNTKGRQIFDLCVWLYGHQSILFGSTIRSPRNDNYHASRSKHTVHTIEIFHGDSQADSCSYSHGTKKAI